MSRLNSRIIPGFDNYSIDRNGNVFNLTSGRILNPYNHRGYNRVSLYKNGKLYKFKIAVLKALCFIPNPHNYKVINHIDGIKHNDEISNLEWCTSEYNSSHAHKMGLSKPPGSFPNNKFNAKLDWGKVRKIRKSQINNRQLAKRYKVTDSIISNIKNMKTWVE